MRCILYIFICGHWSTFSTGHIIKLWHPEEQPEEKQDAVHFDYVEFPPFLWKTQLLSEIDKLSYHFTHMFSVVCEHMNFRTASPKPFQSRAQSSLVSVFFTLPCLKIKFFKHTIPWCKTNRLKQLFCEDSVVPYTIQTKCYLYLCPKAKHWICKHSSGVAEQLNA